MNGTTQEKKIFKFPDTKFNVLLYHLSFSYTQVFTFEVEITANSAQATTLVLISTLRIEHVREISEDIS